MIIPHCGGMFEEGSVSACRPPPVQLFTFAKLLTMHWRVRFEPHSLAAVAHSRNEDTACSPSWLVEPPSALTMSTYCFTAGTTFASSSGMNALRTYEL